MECKNVLVVDDDPAILSTISDVLGLHGYNALPAKNGKEALEQLNIVSADVCLILLDLMMPVMSGWQFLDAIKADSRFREIPVVICSAYLESARSVKPQGIVQKPVHLQPLLSAVKEFCA